MTRYFQEFSRTTVTSTQHTAWEPMLLHGIGLCRLSFLFLCFQFSSRNVSVSIRFETNNKENLSSSLTVLWIPNLPAVSRHTQSNLQKVNAKLLFTSHVCDINDYLLKACQHPWSQGPHSHFFHYLKSFPKSAGLSCTLCKQLKSMTANLLSVSHKEHLS